MTTTELATQEQAQPPAVQQKGGTIRQMLESDDFKKAVEKAMPKHLKPDRFVRIAILATTRTPKLQECDSKSLFNHLITLSSLGIEPDGRRAHLIPFWNAKRNVTEVQLIIDYKGIAELIMRSGMVSFIHADVICENDEFEYDRGEVKRHKVNLRQPRGKMYGAYVIVRMKDGGEKSEVMSKDEIDAIRARSKSGKSGPWCTDYNEMAKKTVFRRASKWLSLSPEIRDAVEADDDHDPIYLTPGEFAPLPVDGASPRRMRLRSQDDTPPNPPADEGPIDPPAPDDVSQIYPDASYAGDE